MRLSIKIFGVFTSFFIIGRFGTTVKFIREYLQECLSRDTGDGANSLKSADRSLTGEIEDGLVRSKFAFDKGHDIGG